MYQRLISSQEKECLQDLVGLSVPGPAGATRARGPPPLPVIASKDEDPGFEFRDEPELWAPETGVS